MGSAIATGLFTLVGVLIGAFASVVGPALLERSRERDEFERAKRLVAAELIHAQMTFRTASIGTHWPPIEDPEVLLPTSAWNDCRAILAGRLPGDMWEALTLQYAALQSHRVVFADRARMAPNAPLDPAAAAALAEMGQKLGRLRRKVWDGGGGWADEIIANVQIAGEEPVQGGGR
jgi:type II secretory pathway pseudopilin PulG